MSEIRRRDGVDDDIYYAAAGLAARSQATAFRFIDRVEQSLNTLPDMPRMGSLKDFQDPHLTDVRTWRIKSFPAYLIYYIAREYGVEVLAIMHGSKPPEETLAARAKGRKPRR